MQVVAMTRDDQFLELFVDGLHPEIPSAHHVNVPLLAIVNRRALYRIPPCAPGHETCTDCTCHCCKVVLTHILVEHLVRLNPDQAPKLVKQYGHVLGVQDMLKQVQSGPVVVAPPLALEPGTLGAL